jgi:spore coat protein CotF
MVSIINAIMGTTDPKMNDQIIANDALAGLKATSTAYLGATLESVTPEVRRMYSEYMTQCTLAHEGLTGLSVKRNWYQPYLNPDEQVANAYQQAGMTLDPKTRS